MVADAGFMLNDENIKASENTALALAIRNNCEKASRNSPGPGDSTLNADGSITNIPFHGNNTLAMPSATTPSVRTRAALNTTPVAHFASSNRRREIGLHRIIRKVP